MAVKVANPTLASITQGANTFPGHSVSTVTLAAGDADALLAGGCVIGPLAGSGGPGKGWSGNELQEGAYLLQRNPR
jgi:hypothetical protein